MLGYQARVREEYEQLMLKINALKKFIDGNKFLELDPRQQGLLYSQLNAMEEYAECLEIRISYFK